MFQNSLSTFLTANEEDERGTEKAENVEFSLKRKDLGGECAVTGSRRSMEFKISRMKVAQTTGLVRAKCEQEAGKK